MLVIKPMVHHFKADLRYRLLLSLFPIILGCLSSLLRAQINLLDHLRVYDNFFAFVLMMVSLDIIIRVAQNNIASVKAVDEGLIGLEKLLKNNKKRNMNNVIQTLLIAIISYSLIFLVYQVLGCSLSLISSGFNLNPSLKMEKSQIEAQLSEVIDLDDRKSDFLTAPPRVLDQQQLQDDKSLQMPNQEVPILKEEKITLSMGNIKSVLKLNIQAMVLSKDKNTVFALGSARVLEIIDITNLASPKIVGSLNYGSVASINQETSFVLTLSADEKTLFVSDFMQLDIINITDLKFPERISLTNTHAVENREAVINIIDRYRSSMFINDETATLYLGAFGLLAYDISDLRNPQQLKAIVNPVNFQSLPVKVQKNQILLSQDKKALFVVNKTLDIYDISNPRDIQLLSSLDTPSLSLCHTSNRNRLLSLGRMNGKAILSEVDVSNYSSPRIITSFKFTTPSDIGTAHFLATSPGQTRYYIHDDTGSLFIFDDLTKTFAQNPKTLIDLTKTLEFSRDGKHVITASNSQFLIIELSQNYPNSEVFPYSMNQISNFSLPRGDLTIAMMTLTPDAKTMFLLTQDYRERTCSFEIWDVSDVRNAHKISSINVNTFYAARYFSSNYQKAYLVFSNKIIALDISNKTSPSPIGTYTNTNSEFLRFDDVAFTSNGKTGFAVLNSSRITGFHLSDSSSELQRFWTINRLNPHGVASWIILKDDLTLIVIDKEITIYNISDIEAPLEIASVPLKPFDTQTFPAVHSPRLSPDKKTLYLQVYNHYDETEPFQLRIYDISVLSFPHLIAEHAFFSADPTKEFITFTSDFKAGFIVANGASDSLLKVQLTDLQKEPKIIGRIPMVVGEVLYQFILSQDDQTIFKINDDRKTISIWSMQPQHSFYLKQEQFLLGKKYSETVGMLNRTPTFDYDLMDQNSYKIVKLSLVDFKLDSDGLLPRAVNSPLPSWISFDYESNRLKLEPQDYDDVGIYTLESAVSFRIPANAFAHLDVSSEELLPWLIALNYIDHQLFLTQSFTSLVSSDSLKTFYLPIHLKDYKQQIYNVLVKFFIRTSTVVEILPSLELKSDGKNLVITTPHSENVKVDIELLGPQAQFLHKSYLPLAPVIIENTPMPRLHFEGSLKDINAALQSIVIDFETREANCNAKFTIHDGLNEPLTVSFTNARKIFKHNQPPALNDITLTVQEQINAINIETGLPFTVDLDKDTFKDNYTDVLTYELVMANNNTELPKWLSLNGLKLRGSPPEEIPKDIELVLVAKNEFKEIKEPFKLHTKISLSFTMKLILKYAPSVLSVIGLIISLNKIFNVVGKDFYKHPKEYIIDSGEKVTSENIAPIFFVYKEKQESKLIIDRLQKYLSKKLHKTVNPFRFVNYFVDPESKQLDKQKLLDMIQTMVSNLSLHDKKELSHYFSTKNSKKALIDQLIIDQLTLWQLDQDKETKSIYDKIKKKWVDMVSWNDSLSKFTLNHNRLEKVVQESLGIIDNLSTSLISGINLYLLEDSILAHAFELHQIDKLPVRVQVSLKEQIKSNCIFRFLKKDLKDVQKVKYGIKYNIINDILSFSGVAKSNVEGKTLVVQIATSKNRILKEIWIRGASESSDNPQLVILNENNYEVY